MVVGLTDSPIRRRTADRHAIARVVGVDRFSNLFLLLKDRRIVVSIVVDPDRKNARVLTKETPRAVYCSLIFLSFFLSRTHTPRVWNHSEVVLVLSPPTSHLLNEPSIDRRHFVVSRFPSHLAAAPALPSFAGKRDGEVSSPRGATAIRRFDQPHLLATYNSLKSFRDLFSVFWEKKAGSDLDHDRQRNMK